MRSTHDPLLSGDPAPPPGAFVNQPWQRSASDPVTVTEGAPAGG